MIVSAAAGAITGAVATTGIGKIANGVVNGVVDGLEYLMTHAISGEEINDSELAVTAIVSGATAGKGMNASKLRGISKRSKDVLKTAKSPKKIAMYNDKIASVKIKDAKKMISTLRDIVEPIGVELANKYWFGGDNR